MHIVRHAFLALGSLLLLSDASLTAAPSVKTDTELIVSFEQEDSIFAMAEISSGQVRSFAINLDGSLKSLNEYATKLPNLTGVTSGYTVEGDEYLAFANVYSNFLSIRSLFGEPLFSVSTLTPGPAFPAVMRPEAGEDPFFGVASLFGQDGYVLELMEDLGGPPNTIASSSSGTPIKNGQPLYRLPNEARFMATLAPKNSEVSELRIYRAVEGKVFTSDSVDVSSESKMVSSVIGTDDRLLILTFVPGENDIQLFTIDEETGKIEDAKSDEIEITIGSIQTASAPGFPRGILIFNVDQTKAYPARVVDGNEVDLLALFEPINGLFAGAASAPGTGIAAFEKDPKGSLDYATSYQTFAPNGSNWEVINSGALSPYPTASSDFATLFWYQGNPLTDQFAKLISMENRETWTRPADGANIPAQVLIEDFAGSADGLKVDESITPSIPSGADHLFTNQFDDTVSFVALQEQSVLTAPQIRIDPVGGTYAAPVFISANYETEYFDLYFREDRAGSPWRTFTQGLPLAYDATLLFYLRSKQDGTQSPIIQHVYDFTQAVDPNLDSDSDGVPDFVEQRFHMNPQGGADNDGDGRSDLEELLDGTDPNDASSFIPRDVNEDGGASGIRDALSLGDGLVIYAQAKTQTGGIASPGQPLSLRELNGALLQSAPVEVLSAPAPLAGQTAAQLRSEYPVASGQWLVLSTPTFFTLGTGSSPPSGGIEQFRILSAEPPTPPSISPPLSGADIVSDADAWITAAQTAYGSYTPVNEIHEFRPKHNITTVIAESVLFDALMTLEPDARSTLAVPDAVTDFTILSARSKDAERTPLSPAMERALKASGFDFPASIEQLDTSLELPVYASLRSFAGTLRNFFRTNQPTIPNIPLPIDALRSVLHSGTLPSEYTGAASPAQVTSFSSQMALLQAAGGAYRPTATWTIDVESAPAGLSEHYGFRRNDLQLVSFVDSIGEPFYFDQGLGLTAGTAFEVTGYTDIPAESALGRPVMEIISINSVSLPVVSEGDLDGDFLADDWERYFSESGDLDALSSPAGSSYSFLQYFLAGADPRNPASLSGPVLDFTTPVIRIVELGDQFALEWDWPTEFEDRFEFTIDQTADLNFASAGNLVSGRPVVIDSDTLRLPLGVAQSGLDKNFFRLRLQLMPTAE